MVLQSGIGLWLAGLGLALAIFIVMVGIALNMADGPDSTMGSDDRRDFLSGIVSLSIIGIVVAFLGSEAIGQLSTEGTLCELVVNDGETYTVESGETQSFCETEVNGTLQVNGTLALTE